MSAGRIPNTMAIVALVTGALAGDAASPVVLDPFAMLDVYSEPNVPSPVRYMGQPAKEGTIDLTPSNGFFDRCFRAVEPAETLPGDEELIRGSFGYLARGSEDVLGSARWHLWCPAAGEITVQFFVQVPADEESYTWAIKVGGQVGRLDVEPSDGNRPQPRTLTFSVKQPGKVTLTIDCSDQPPPEKTRIRFVRLQGSAIDRASLLRVRWRPAAVHTRYEAPPECPEPNLWVFETRATTTASSYSPLTTPFGYYGTSFSNRRVKGGFNFSMWIAGRNATAAPPVAHMARLIGTAYPESEYSDFGHEGTGVKFRGGIAYPDGADRAIQALRIEMTDGLRTYLAYVYDEQTDRWRLYASGQEPTKQLKQKPEEARGLDRAVVNSTGSFCEIPGPPDRERSGDIVREMKRRGWFYGRDGTWYRAQLPSGTGGVDRKTGAVLARIEQGERVVLHSKRAYYMDDYPTQGWIGMRTGGMECYHPGAQFHDPQPGNTAEAVVPEYLTPEKTRQLFELPVEFGDSKATEVTATSAAIEYEIEKTGPNSRAVMWYGTVDALTFTPREVQHGSVVQKQMYSPERTWQHATPEQAVTIGKARFAIAGLQSGTIYYYRLFVNHDQGKSWDYQSGQFRTQ